MPFGFLFRREVDPRDDNPCRKVCALNLETRLCMGCRRKPNEIASWMRLSTRQRQAILKELPSRRQGELPSI